MRILLSSVGTRGDVQPALALALELRALGHEVRACLPPNFIDWARQLGFAARPLGIEMRAPRPGEKPAPIPDLITDQFETLQSAAQDCDLIVGAGAHQYAARSIAQKSGIPCVIAVYAAFTLEQPRDSWDERSLERVNANRGRLALPPIEHVLGHILGDHPWLAADPILGPGNTEFQTGAWILPDSTPLNPELERFLEQGDPPIYLGFGSMPAAPDSSRVLIEAARTQGRRVLLSQGWADLKLIDDARDCLALGEVNQQRLFPRVAAVIHHGGAGTTTAAARAGVPQVAVPMFSDQFYWARRIRELEIGSSAELCLDSLSSALQQALQKGPQARRLAPQIKGDGAAVAARRLQQRPEGVS